MVEATSPLIDVVELAAAVTASTGPRLLDVRWQLGGPSGEPSYRYGHVPGAVFVDLDTQLSGPPGTGGRHPLPDPGTFEEAMRRAGVSDEVPVVAYDAGDCMAAARLWWLLRYFGHTRVRVLDGGYAAWVEAAAPVESDVPEPERGDFTAHPGSMPSLDAAGAAALTRSGVLLDARAPRRYRGEVEPVDAVAGHIPGAINAPTSENMGADGRFRAGAELRRRFEDLGAAATVEVGVYCGSGVSAAHEVLALELAGIDAALYAGSWSHWITDASRPVATGEEPGV